MLPNNSAADARWMDAAARIALRGRPLSRPNPSIGCVIVKDAKVIARGWTQAGGRPHAEAHALGLLAEREVEGATVYATLEPCAHRSERGSACAQLLASARPARVVAGMLDPDPRTAGKGVALLEEAGIAVDVLDSASAADSIAGYLTRAALSRPHVTLKLAMSQDGFIARGPDQDPWITGEIARAHVHSRRALCDAILVGGETWRADRPKLDVRLPGIEDRSPARYVLTREASLEGVSALASPEDIAQMPDAHYLYVEGGAGAAQAFLDAGLVDALHLYVAPITIGSGMKAPEALLPEHLARSPEWKLREKRQLGSDTFTAYQRLR